MRESLARRKKHRVFLGVVVPRTTTFFELINSKKKRSEGVDFVTQGVDFVTQGLVIKKFNNVVIELDSERIKQLTFVLPRRCMSVAHTTFFLINKLIKKKSFKPLFFNQLS